ncbi:MAG: C40 family peptidase [Dermatophilaceae bacterium]|nr:C40 family peptidase [Intrasporangiaceae bacterium]
MTAVRDALQSVDRLSSLTVEGKKLSRDVVEAVTRAELERNIDGSSTLEIKLHDSTREIIRSPLFKSSVIAKIDDRAYSLVKVRKSQDDVSLTFEDLAIASLRSHDEPLKVAPGTTTHVAFVRRLVKEESWLKLFVPPDVKPPRAQVELARGEPGKEVGTSKFDVEAEDSWKAIGRIGSERGWRRFVRNQNEIWYVPDTWLYKQKPSFKVSENTNGVDEIDFDYDVGKPVATAKILARAARWAVPVGSVIEIEKSGPADGKWLVSSIRRDVFSLTVTIELTQPQPELPEPEPQAESSVSERGESGYGSPEDLAIGALAGVSSGALPSAPSAPSAPSGGTVPGGLYVNRVVSLALAQRGKPYIWGGKTTRGFDCSGLVSHATRLAGRELSSGSVNQYNACRNAGTLISVSQAINTRGALLFRIGRGSAPGANHVAISLGNGQTIEAKGRAWGVGVFSASGRGWNGGARIPGFNYSQAQPGRQSSGIVSTPV